MLKRVAFSGLLTTSLSFAYSPGAHKDMVEAASLDYNYCVEELKLGQKKLTRSDIKKIIHGNLREDINPSVKLKHWHFYHPTKDLGKGLFGEWGYSSFVERYKEAEGKLKKRNHLKALGTKSHYLQDVTNPAHVAPIYHGLGDGFDFYDFKSNWPEKITREKCESILEKVKAGRLQASSFPLVQRVTLETLARMQEKILVVNGTYNGFYSWEEAFWSTKVGPASKQAEFGQYGFLGNTFGRPESGVDTKVMADFAKERVRAALDATVELFLLEL